MQDDPPAALLVAEARKALEHGLAAGFPQKVAANALGIAQRELELAPSFAEAERERLAELIGRGGPLADLNREFAQAVRESDAPNNHGLVRHLVLATCAKLAVDQPGYPGYRAWRSTLPADPC